jgi:hypothetical protein
MAIETREVEGGGSGTVLPADLPVPAGGTRQAAPAGGRHPLCRRRSVRQPSRPPRLLERADREPNGPATIIFNGDFHWLDVDPNDFQTISETVLAHHGIKGNVEAELTSDEAAGCGCAYPNYISDDVVDRSNQIMTRLRATAARFPELVGRLGALPRYLTASVGGQRVGILHGDPESLAGWRLALEAMEPGDALVRRQVGWHGQPTTASGLLDWFRRAEASVFACTHTGLPYAQNLTGHQGRRRLVINNGSAGLANFTGTSFGVITRLSSSPQPPADSLYGISIDGLRRDAVPLAFDLEWWRTHFVAQWPPNSPAHTRYDTRITQGTPLLLQQAIRGNVTQTART